MKYFTKRELADRETGVMQLAPAFGSYPGFGARLDALREAWGKPLMVTSCCRTAARNERIGGHPRSLHVYDKPFHDTGGTAACDFALMLNSNEDELFKDLAWSMGFSIGDECHCIHVDDRIAFGMPQARFSYRNLKEE